MITGWLYQADSAARQSAGLSVSGATFSLAVDGKTVATGNVHALAVSDRVGNIPRRITLPDGAVFETADNDAIDSWLQDSSHRAARIGLLHHLESHWQWIALSVIVVVLVGFVTVRWGMPWASHKLAYAMPDKVTEIISAETMEILDRVLFEESCLDEFEQQRLRKHFNQVLLPMQQAGFEYRLHFRRMSDIPNALALPAGDIIITDRLIEIAASQEEIDAVLLHEIGHVVHRHGLQQVLHSSMLTMALIMISGDLSATGNIAIALPVFLLESHYSREHESEADRYAFEQMMTAGIDPAYFGSIMEKMSADMEDNVADPDKSTPPDDDETRYEYLSTHPPTPARIERAQQYSTEFRQQQDVRSK